MSWAAMLARKSGFDSQFLHKVDIRSKEWLLGMETKLVVELQK
jgi:hypothetical protein